MKGLGNLANLAGMVKQAKEMQQKLSDMREELAQQEVTATAGGGMVTVTMNGKQIVTSIKIEPDIVDPENVSMLEDLVLVAVNDAQERTQEMVKERMSEITGGISIPGLSL